MSAPHLHDDDLSASLDGFELAPDDAAHLAACDRCRARLHALGEAAEALRAPMPVPAGLRDTAVERALTAEVGAEAGAGRFRAGRRRGPAPWVAGVAAAVVVILGVSFVSRVGDGGDDSLTSASSNALDGGDLGELDAASLRERVGGVLEPKALEDSSGAASGGGGQMENTGPADTGGGDASDEQAPSVMATREARAGRRTGNTAACEAIVRERYDRGLIGELVYRATGTWQGEDALVLAYRVAEPRGQLDHLVYVVAEDDCELLNVQAF